MVLEARSREYVEGRVRAGVLEQGSVDLLRASVWARGSTGRASSTEGINLQFAGERHGSR